MGKEKKVEREEGTLAVPRKKKQKAYNTKRRRTTLQKDPT